MATNWNKTNNLEIFLIYLYYLLNYTNKNDKSTNLKNKVTETLTKTIKVKKSKYKNEI